MKDHFQDLAEDEGVDPEDLSLDFGVFEVLNRFTGFARQVLVSRMVVRSGCSAALSLDV